MHHQLGVHFLNLLGNQTKLWGAGVAVLIAKGHRLKCQDRFAGSVDQLNVCLKSLGGGQHAELAGARVHDGWYAVVESCPSNTCNKDCLLAASRDWVELCADADRTGLCGHTLVSDVDVVVACGEVKAGKHAQCDVG